MKQKQVSHNEKASIEDTREFIRIKFTNDLGCEKLGKQMESAMYNWSIKSAKCKSVKLNWKNIAFRRVYLNKYRSLHFNFNKLPDLVSKVKQKNVKITDMITMSPYDMIPDQWVPIIHTVEKKRDMLAVKSESEEEDYESLFQCRKCMSKHTTHYSMQTRSADEPMTTFVKCKNCGTSWKC